MHPRWIEELDAMIVQYILYSVKGTRDRYALSSQPSVAATNPTVKDRVFCM